MNSMEGFAPFWAHVDALRRTFLKVLSTISIGIILVFIFHKPLYQQVVCNPLNQTNHPVSEATIKLIKLHNRSLNSEIYTLASNETIENLTNAVPIGPNTYLIFKEGSLLIQREMTTKFLYVFGPIEGMYAILKLCLWTGITATAPVWIFFLIQFIYPALQNKERRLLLPFLLLSFFFISVGCAFAFLITIPLANTYLQAFNQNIGINLWSLSNYLDYTFLLLLANGLAFELAAIGLFLVQIGLISFQWLAAKRRSFILIAFIGGAVLTPPDVLTQMILAVTMIGIYEGVILYAKLKSRLDKKSKSFPILCEHGSDHSYHAHPEIGAIHPLKH